MCRYAQFSLSSRQLNYRGFPLIFLKYMLIAEHSVKSPLTYHFKKIYGENQQEYLALIHYAVTKANQKNIQQIVQLKP